jgi:hypothetical protein
MDRRSEERQGRRGKLSGYYGVSSDIVFIEMRPFPMVNTVAAGAGLSVARCDKL